MTNDDERKLVLAAQQNDKEALSQIITLYFPRVQNRARKYNLKAISSYADYSDLTSEGVAAIMHAIEKFDTSKNIEVCSFFMVCADNRMKSYLKKIYAKIRKLNVVTLNDDDNAASTVAAKHSNPEEIVIRKEKQHSFLEILNDSLSPFEKKVVQKRLDGKTYKRIAAELNTTPRSVDNALQRIRKKLDNRKVDK